MTKFTAHEWQLAAVPVMPRRQEAEMCYFYDGSNTNVESSTTARSTSRCPAKSTWRTRSSAQRFVLLGDMKQRLYMKRTMKRVNNIFQPEPVFRQRLALR